MRQSSANSLLLVGGVAILVAIIAFVRETRRDGAVSAETASAQALPRMVDVGSDKCIACREMAPILAKLKTEYAGRAEIVFIDIWKNSNGGDYGVRVIPTQIFFDRQGREVWRHEGFLPRDEIVAKLRQLGAG
jgi:thioredoxin 1